MTSLRDFIAKRQSEIDEQIARLNDELLELKTAMTALEKEHRKPAKVLYDSGRVTIKGMIVDVLEKRPHGGTAEDIIEWVKDEYSENVRRTSLSPQLSRLKAEGILILEHSKKIWRLARYVEQEPKENAPPSEGGAEAGEVTASPYSRPADIFG